MLPGVGSYIALATKEQSVDAILYAILTMLVVILLYDQLLFRPLLAWGDKFKAELTARTEMPSSWVLTMIRRSFLARLFKVPKRGLQGPLLPSLPQTIKKTLLFSRFIN